MEGHSGKKIEEGLQKILSAHGYGFHYAVLRNAMELYHQRKSKWIFEVAEFPVTVRGVDTRIDFILKAQDPSGVYWDCFLVAECKRVNPALSDWCFVHTPYVRRNHKEMVIAEKLTFADSHPPVSFGQPLFSDLKNTYHLGFEIRSGEKGEIGGKGRGQIEDAATQISKGLNGIVEEFRRHGDGFSRKTPSVHFIPVIFTSAQVWTSEIALDEADLRTGEFSLKDIHAERRGWVWLQYHLSPGIKHSVDSLNKTAKGLGEILAQDYIRTIAVVSVAGIGEFLGIDWYLFLE